MRRKILLLVFAGFKKLFISGNKRQTKYQQTVPNILRVTILYIFFFFENLLCTQTAIKSDFKLILLSLFISVMFTS